METIQPKISVVIPIFNSEKYLKDTVESVLAQSFTDFELILVDDGSTDNSPRICDEYAKWDERVRVIHKKNAGVSMARNTGIEEAKGEYLFFCDSDDYVFQDMFEVCVHEVRDTDLLVAGFLHVRDLTEGLAFRKTDRETKTIALNEKEVHDNFKNVFNWIGGVWRCLFKRDILIKNNLRFKNVEAEDELFIYNYLAFICSAVRLDNFDGYCYIVRQRSRSSSHRAIVDLDWLEGLKESCSLIMERYDQKDWKIYNYYVERFLGFIQKGYYKDTRVGYSERINRWSYLKNDSWLPHVTKSDFSIKTKLLIFVCKTSFYKYIDALFVLWANLL